MRALCILLLLCGSGGTIAGQAVQRKHLLTSLGGGAGLVEMRGPVDSLRIARTECGVVHFGFAYALGDRWSLGFRYERIGTDRQSEPFDRVRFTSYLVQAAYRPWIGRRSAVELHLGLGPAIMALTPSKERLTIDARTGLVNIGGRFLHLFGGTVGAFIGVDHCYSGDAATSFQGNAITEANGDQALVSWKSDRITAGLLIRY